jgi:5-deoxy-glucuronate isomerase
MSKLKVKPLAGTGEIADVTPESAGWKYTGFQLHRLADGDTASGGLDEMEACLVFITGKGDVLAGGEVLGTLGGRTSVFDGKPWSVYVPAGAAWSVTAEGPLELAVCRATATRGSHPVRVIRPEDTSQETRGKGTNVRYVTNILPDNLDAAHALLVVEVITPGGHSSSYPPHKHDTDDPPRETLLEEVYYHRLKPASGFAFQRVYTDDRSLDEAMVLEDGDITLVPKGYHPCAATHGHDLYYLNVMAGPKRLWKFHNDPAHEWLLKA